MAQSTLAALSLSLLLASSLAAQAAIDNCPCPFGDDAKEVARYERCLKKQPGAALKAFKAALRYVGAPGSEFRAALLTSVEDYDSECRASWEPVEEEEDPGFEEE
jgi:hypothetical protein